MKAEPIATWKTRKARIALSHHPRLGLTVRVNGRLAGFKLSIPCAQDLVNRIAGRPVWTA